VLVHSGRNNEKDMRMVSIILDIVKDVCLNVQTKLFV